MIRGGRCDQGDSLQEGDGYSVVGDGDAGKDGFAYTGAYDAGVSHAGSAVDDEAVWGQVFREVVTGGDVNPDISVIAGLTGNPFPKKRRNLYAANVFRVRDMGAGFGNENAAAGLE